MNIFASSSSPLQSARALDDARLIKMVLETAQILCTIAHKHSIPAPYKPTHKNHPAVLWAEQPHHLSWLTAHFEELSLEYTYRFNKIHKSWTTVQPILADLQAALPERIPLPITEWPSTIGGSHLACRALLSAKWDADRAKGRPPRWTCTCPPEWLTNKETKK